MASKFILLNGHKWRVKLLAENAVLLENEAAIHHAVHSTTAYIHSIKLDGITDVIPTYTSIAIIFDLLLHNSSELIKLLENSNLAMVSSSSNAKLHCIEVDYSKGLDWEDVVRMTGLTRAEIIQKHTAKEYLVEMMGFVPGFVYLSGMDVDLECARRENPRVRIPAGAVGIGGKQTGIYALESPGGWQIIGQTDAVLFDPKAMPPNQLNVGDMVRFVVK